MKTKVAILHTNDLHSHFENFPKIKRFMQSKTDELEAQGYTVFRVDDGDAMDRSNPLTDVTNGQFNVELLNQIHYQVATIGNNEVLTNSHADLEHLYDKANFKVILDNVDEKNSGKKPKWANRYVDYKLPNGDKLRFMALTFPYPTFQMLGWLQHPVYETIADEIKQWSGDYDVLVLLSHLGINYDRGIAKRFPEISIIIGGHTHHLLPTGEIVNDTLLTAAEKWGHYVGVITFEVDGKTVTNRQAEVIKTSELAEEPEDAKWIKSVEDKGEAMLAAEKVADLPKPLTTSLNDDNSMIDAGLKALEAYTETDAAVLNTGLFLKNLPAGIIDMNQIQQVLPHNIHAMKTELWGFDLVRLIKEMEKNKKFLIHFEQKGMGFRGIDFGLLVYAGISYDDKHDRVLWHGKRINPLRKYKIGLIDHYDFIPFFPTVDIAGKNKIYFEGTLKQIFADYLAKKYPIRNEQHES
ncbi:bifunctional metallophosphatase/5'-nucleotidase [Fructilactobacillus sp. Tb1]|uniref:bifunctional metallophosphatase/5'-nucleotidase n=1 Tax=Fructilactobacillus sp. Tb1 TaxID=3422304 RepID=UPI003D2E3E47